MLMEPTLEQLVLLDSATILLDIAHVHAKKTTAFTQQWMGSGRGALLQDLKR